MRRHAKIAHFGNKIGGVVGFAAADGDPVARITVLLLCLQLKQLVLGVALVMFFSIGLAVTMVSAGVIASLSVKQIQKRWSGFSAFARRAPYASSGLMILIALYMGVSGYMALRS